MRRPILFLAVLAALAAVVTTLAVPGSSAGAAVSRAGLSAKVAPPTATKVVYVRPVTVSGRPAPGWTVTRQAGSVFCSGTSPSAVNPGITSCYPTVLGLRACWKSARHTVLCVRDATERTLVRVRYEGRYPAVNGPRTPAPMNLTLGDGRTCLIRLGGAWGSPAQHPRWVGFDTCSRSASVYASGLSVDGINHGNRRWTVKLWRHGVDRDGVRLVTRGVVTAYVVGSAAD